VSFIKFIITDDLISCDKSDICKLVIRIVDDRLLHRLSNIFTFIFDNDETILSQMFMKKIVWLKCFVASLTNRFLQFHNVFHIHNIVIILIKFILFKINFLFCLCDIFCVSEIIIDFFIVDFLKFLIFFLLIQQCFFFIICVIDSRTIWLIWLI